MAHLVYNIDGEDSMAYVGDTPWHGLGQKLDPHTPLEVWAKKAHLDWAVGSSMVKYELPMGFRGSNLDFSYEGRKVLFRTDTLEPLSVVGKGYHVVQPIEILEFYRDLIAKHGFQMHTAGSLDEGRRIWALAKIGDGFDVKNGKDRIEPYMLLATSYDTSLSTTLMLTSIRVVCNNTLEFAYGGSNEDGVIKVPHNRKFDPEAVKIESGVILDGWRDFQSTIEIMADKDMSYQARLKFFNELILGEDYMEAYEYDEVSKSADKAITSLMELASGIGRGTKFESSDGTLWGVINAVTEYVDHNKPARSTNNRFKAAVSGTGRAMKRVAWKLASRIMNPSEQDNG